MKKINNCHKSEAKRHYEFNVQCPCDVCQRYFNKINTVKITSQHVLGKFCGGGNKNQCSVCAKIKTKIRLFKHLTGKCYKNCPYCKNHNAINYTKKQVILWLYRYFLKYVEKEVRSAKFTYEYRNI